jgi:hypothetical protein
MDKKEMMVKIHKEVSFFVSGLSRISVHPFQPRPNHFGNSEPDVALMADGFPISASGIKEIISSIVTSIDKEGVLTEEELKPIYDLW